MPSTQTDRREARRRKILENSTSRLQRIANVNRAEENLLSADSSDEMIRTYTPPVRHTNTTTQDDSFSMRTVFQSRATFDDSSLDLAFGTNKQRLCMLVFLAVFINIANHVCKPRKYFLPVLGLDVRDVFLDKIFSPLVFYEILDVTLFHSYYVRGVLTQPLLFFGNMSYETVSHISAVVSFVIKVVQDLLVYFLVFVVTDLCIKANYHWLLF